MADDEGTDTSEVETDEEGTDTPDPKAEAEKWKTLARKHEDRAKANAAAAKELEKVKQSAMSDTEKAVAEAKAAARAEALKETALERVGDAAVAAAAGKLRNPEYARRLLDLASLVDDEGSFDRKAVAKAVDQLVKDDPDLAVNGSRVNGSGDGGARGSKPAADMNAFLRAAAGRS